MFVHHLGEVKLRQKLLAPLGHVSAVAQGWPPLPALPQVLRQGHGQSVQRGEAFKLLVDLKCAHQATAHPLVWRQVADVFTQQANAAFGGRKHAGQQIDERGFARAIGTDERMTRSAGNVQADLVGGSDAAKALDQAFTRQHDVAHDVRPQVHGRNKRSRPTNISNTKNSPSQKVQY